MAHTHHCVVCNNVVAVCGDAGCQSDEGYCTLHHPDPDHHAEDKPVVRMTVAIAKED